MPSLEEYEMMIILLKRQDLLWGVRKARDHCNILSLLLTQQGMVILPPSPNQCY